jgi:N4-gp56 family major capsid protein
MSIFYDKVFLERLKAMLRFGVGAYTRSIPANSGKTIIFNRMSLPTLATTALTEGTTPSSIALSTAQVTATINIYGSFTQTSEFFAETSIDEGLKEQVSVMGQHGAETVNQIVRGVMTSLQTTPGSTIQRASALATDFLVGTTATAVLTGQEVRRAVRTLKTNKSMPFEDGYFKCIIPVEAAYDLRGSTEWLDAQRYTDPSLIKNGEIGRLHGVIFYETNDATVTAGGTVTATQNFVATGTTLPIVANSLTGTGATTTPIYETFVFGQQAYAVTTIEGADSGKDPVIILKKSDSSDTSNPLNLYSTIGWKSKFAAIMLNTLWSVAVRSTVGA